MQWAHSNFRKRNKIKGYDDTLTLTRQIDIIEINPAI